MADDESNDGFEAFAVADAGEDGRPVTAHLAGVAVHDLQRGADVVRKIGLVDDEQIALGNARAAPAWDLVAAVRRFPNEPAKGGMTTLLLYDPSIG